jgi:hypothetical protein
MSISIITDYLSKIPTKNDQVMAQIWQFSKMTYQGKTGYFDCIDEYSSRLVCSALQSHKRILIMFPDSETHRPAMIFASALIWYWRYQNEQKKVNYQLTNTILYFGSTIGVRKQLGEIGIKGFNIDMKKAFKQKSISKQDLNVRYSLVKTVASSDLSPVINVDLPSVITVFSPANPVKVIKEHKPDWISIELSDSSNLDWLQPVLDEATRRNIAVIAWSNNPLSSHIESFDKYGTIFTWPQFFFNKSNYNPQEVDLQSTFYPKRKTNLRPCILTGDISKEISSNISKVNSLLIKSSKQSDGRFERDTIKLLTKYVRSIESLSVPLSIYEIESERSWGCSSLQKIRKTCGMFIDNFAKTSPIYPYINESYSCLSSLHDMFETNQSPIWELLSNICIVEPKVGCARVIVFTSDTKKRMALLSLLAKWNISEDDLRGMRIFLTSPKYLKKLTEGKGQFDTFLNIECEESIQKATSNLTWEPVIVGLPSTYTISNYLPLFHHNNVDFIIYPHQYPLFQWIMSSIEPKLNPSFHQMFKSINVLSNIPIPDSCDLLPIRVQKTEPFEINISTTKLSACTHTNSELYSSFNQISEIERLFMNNEDEDGNADSFSANNTQSNTEKNDDGKDMFCTKAIELHFEHGWKGLFAIDDMINVVITKGNSREIDLRYIRSLQKNDEVIIIHGQRKQSLYDLIISRVHKNPEIELHIALIKKWQSEFAFELDNQYTGDSRFYDFLEVLRQKGSKITTESSIRLWYKGFVMCPQDPIDLTRIAEILDINFIKSNKKYIENAATRLRGLHHSLSLKLNNWLTDQALGNTYRDDDDVIDEKLGLVFSDIRDSIYDLRVVDFVEVSGIFLRSTLGLVEKE